MPIRRRGDGEIVDEKTQPVHTERAGSDSESALGAPTVPVGNNPRRESLFDTDDVGGRLDAPTEPLGKTKKRRRAGSELDGPEASPKTRVFRPNRGEASPTHLSMDQDEPMADPPTGWLVVVQGPGQGRVLTLGSGMNAIGRSEESRVRLDFGDDNVSRTNHARLIYEPRTRRWLLSHGDGTNLTYLNGEVVVSVEEIESGAEIQIGATTMRFQAFCSKAFDWSDLDA